tara:strand:- start:164 stop:670 length:507 start_codon:yes stop_codon:yes gene_type:complete
MMFNPFNTGGRGIASLIQPLLMGIGSQINQSTNTQLNDFGQKVEQLVSESFPELEMNQPMGMQVARPIQAQNRNRFLSMFSPQTRPQIRPLEPQGRYVGSKDDFGQSVMTFRPAIPDIAPAIPSAFPMIPGGEELVRKQNELQKLQNIFGINSPGGISSLAQMLPRAT